jgi:hypothetical protein
MTPAGRYTTNQCAGQKYHLDRAWRFAYISYCISLYFALSKQWLVSVAGYPELII